MKKKLLSTLVVILVGLCYYFDLPIVEIISNNIEKVNYEIAAVEEGMEIPVTPQGTPEQVLHKTNYTVSFNKKTNIPNWVAWSITSDELIERESRSNNFQPDPELPSHSAVTTEDYTGSGYDRGHMCPAADNRYHWRAMDESFYMTNICPQNHNLNAGVWSTLEQQCRKWAETGSTVYIACGPIIDPKQKAQHIGDKHKVRVPDGFFKVVLFGLEGNNPRAYGFVFENKSGKKALEHYARTVDEIETLTGFDFFSPLDDSIEKRIEATKLDL